MTTLYLLRHGDYENPEYVFPTSTSGFPLSVNGRSQVMALIPYFTGRPIVSLYSSPILRTRQTADILADALKLPVVPDDRLMEVKTTLEGVSMKLFDDTKGELSYLPQYTAKGAETMEALSDRVWSALEDFRTHHEGKEVIVVSHGDPIRFSLMKYLGMPMDFAMSRKIQTPLAGGYRLVFGEGRKPEVYPIVAP
jgi:probable phosphoglycerate mutase